MSRKAAQIEPRALTMVEQAVHLLRRNSGQALAEYYLGSLPFVLALLYFWSDMSRNPLAGWYCGPSAAGVALTFIWMKLWQVRFCRRLWCRLQDAPPESWPWQRVISTTARQTFLHAVGIVILPLSAIIALPLGWVYAFYQNLCVLDAPRTKDLTALARIAREQAALWPGQNHLALTIMSLFGLIVFFNLGLGLMAVPYLLKWILGIETVFTLSGMRLLNTTFLAALGGLTYLCIDPILKTLYVLRCFYGRSRQTGDDIRAALRPFISAVLLAVPLLACMPSGGMAQSPGDATADGGQAKSDSREFERKLDDAIETVLQQRRFAWRLPREAVPQPEEDQGWIASTIRWIAHGVKAVARTVGRWIEAFMEWLREKMPDPKSPQPGENKDYRGLIRLIFYALGFGLTLLLIYWLVRWLVRSRSIPSDATGPVALEEIDLTDESITAEDLPLDRWVTMARDLMVRNDFRRAMRALYLSVLALLADHQRVTIARYKSNLDYTRELARHAHAEPDLLRAFDWCVQIFERTWYGMHPVSKLQVDRFMDQQKRIADLVQRTA